TPSSCHHPIREPHRCHPGPCPPCRQLCFLPLPGCEHTCPQPCHDLVLVRSQQVQLAGPWEQPSEPAFVKKALPCPPCQVPIATSCFGEHEVRTRTSPVVSLQQSSGESDSVLVSPVPCHRQGRFSCKRACGRPLACGNHSCSRECHLVTNGNKNLMNPAEQFWIIKQLHVTQLSITGMSDPGLQTKPTPSLADEVFVCLQCEVCEDGCRKPRPPGCPHQCPRPCHPGDCPPCSQMIRQRCHCRISTLYVECRRWRVPCQLRLDLSVTTSAETSRGRSASELVRVGRPGLATFMYKAILGPLLANIWLIICCFSMASMGQKALLPLLPSDFVTEDLETEFISLSAFGPKPCFNCATMMEVYWLYWLLLLGQDFPDRSSRYINKVHMNLFCNQQLSSDLQHLRDHSLEVQSLANLLSVCPQEELEAFEKRQQRGGPEARMDKEACPKKLGSTNHLRLLLYILIATVSLLGALLLGLAFTGKKNHLPAYDPVQFTMKMSELTVLRHPSGC
ncbi:hypothetical protein GOODEAATRI_011138, partial [Goodea atripinnis]